LGYQNNCEIREQSIQDLVNIGGQALDQLIDALKHKNYHIRRGIAEVLGMIRSKRAE